MNPQTSPKKFDLLRDMHDAFRSLTPQRRAQAPGLLCASLAAIIEEHGAADAEDFRKMIAFVMDHLEGLAS